MKTKSGWLTFTEAPSGHTPGAVLLATSGYLLCRSADEKVQEQSHAVKNAAEKNAFSEQKIVYSS